MPAFGECHEAVHVSFRVMAADGGQSRAAGHTAHCRLLSRQSPGGCLNRSRQPVSLCIDWLRIRMDRTIEGRCGAGSIGRGRRVERMTRAWRCAAIRRRVVGGSPLPCAGAGRVDSPCRAGARISDAVSACVLRRRVDHGVHPVMARDLAPTGCSAAITRRKPAARPARVVQMHRTPVGRRVRSRPRWMLGGWSQCSGSG